MNTMLQIKPLTIQLIILHEKMRTIIIKIIIVMIQTKDLTLITLINQIFSNNIQEMNKHDSQEIIQDHSIIFFKPKTQSIRNLTNQLKCITKIHCRITYNNLK